MIYYQGSRMEKIDTDYKRRYLGFIDHVTAELLTALI